MALFAAVVEVIPGAVFPDAGGDWQQEKKTIRVGLWCAPCAQSFLYCDHFPLGLVTEQLQATLIAAGIVSEFLVLSVGIGSAGMESLRCF